MSSPGDDRGLRGGMVEEGEDDVAVVVVGMAEVRSWVARADGEEGGGSGLAVTERARSAVEMRGERRMVDVFFSFCLLVFLSVDAGMYWWGVLGCGIGRIGFDL